MPDKLEMMEKARELILKYSLENAVKYEGRANEKAVMQKTMATHPELRKMAKAIQAIVEKTIQEVNKLSLDSQIEKLKELAPELLEKKEHVKKVPELPPLKNAVPGKVVTRYAPAPNGEMHLGHAFTAFFAHYYVKKYGGTFILRFEDTNPKQDKIEYMDAHREALEWLGLKPDKEVIVSNELEILYAKAEELIKKNFAYTCSCPVDKMRELRNAEKSCEHSRKTPEETMSEWKRMLAGEFDEGEIVLRLRGDMQSQNAVMRDPAIFTIRKGDHCIQGTRYPVWSLYDFAVAVEDSLCGITHIGRSAEFDARIELQNKIRDLLGLLPHPEIFHYARFNVIGSPASKRLIRPLVEEGKVEGWDDIRLVTIKGLRRRGIIPETIKQIATEVGVTTQPTNIDWSLISATNRKIIDSRANRYFFVPDPVVLFVKEAPADKVCKLSLHPDHPERGTKTIKTNNLFLIPREDYDELKVGELFRLKDLYNVKLVSKDVDLLSLLQKDDPDISISGNIPTALLKKFSTHTIGVYAGEELKPGAKIQWTVADPNETIDVSIKIPGILFIDDKFNENSLQIVEGIGEKAINKLKENDIVQFERFGFIRIDRKEKGRIFANLAHK